jgi:hypothetical protein
VLERVLTVEQLVELAVVAAGRHAEPLLDQRLLDAVRGPPVALEVEDRPLLVRQRHADSLPVGTGQYKHPRLASLPRPL